MKEKKHNGFKTFVMVLTLILVSPVFSISVSASELTDNEKLHTETTGASKGNSVPDQILNSEDFKNVKVGMNDVKKLEAYLKLNADGTLTLDPSYTKLDISRSVTNEVQEWIKYLNGLVKQKEAVINSDFSVKILDKDGSVLTLENGNNNKMKVAKKAAVDLVMMSTGGDIIFILTVMKQEHYINHLKQAVEQPLVLL